MGRSAAPATRSAAGAAARPGICRSRITDEDGTIWRCSLDPGHRGPVHIALNHGHRGDPRVKVFRWSAEPLYIDDEAIKRLLAEYGYEPMFA